MRLFSGPAPLFIEATTRNRIADEMADAFFEHFRYRPSPAEVASWRNSLRAMKDVMHESGLQDSGVLLEYQLPLSSKRLDCMLTGGDEHGRPAAVVVELKQWESCQTASGDHEVITWLGGEEREVLHPAAQVGQYRMYLQDMHSAFYMDEDPIGLSACSYLHNYPFDPEDPLFDSKYAEIIRTDPVFTRDDFDHLAGFLGRRVGRGPGMPVLERVETSELRPSKKLMDHVAAMIEGRPEYVLLDEQLVVFDKVLAVVREAVAGKRRHAIIIRGGPGTGKSVIAINLMGRLLRDGRSVDYATGSKAFTETLRNVIGRRGSVQFKYFNSYREAPRDSLDVLICDEAHRIRENSSSLYTPAARRSKRPQINELLSVTRVAVFFIDDDQVVRPGEIGSSELIRRAAERARVSVDSYELEAQFRCAGSEAFVSWINNTLGIHRTAHVLWQGDERFDFRIMRTPEQVEAAIREKVAAGNTGRMVAGFCWPWSKKPRPDGSLVADVEIGGYHRPWNARHDATRLAPGIPKAQLWARAPGGIDQIGCVYTAQGFEFDYVGVIFGADLVWDPDEGCWKGNRKASHDAMVKRGGDRFVELVKNTYRVLLSRGLKGCYVTFLDRETERFFRSRMG